MGAKSGALHHNVVKTQQNRARVLELVSQGFAVEQAVLMAGCKAQVLRRWLTDEVFVAALEGAQKQAAKSVLSSIKEDKYGIDFATFCREFLDTEVFPCQQNMVDLLEGREPGFLHEAMRFVQGDPKRVMVTIPPEHAKSTTISVNYIVYQICVRPNVRVVLVSKTQKLAKEFLYSIKQRLTEERWIKLQQVYGPAEGWKATADQWTQDKIYLKRDSEDKDPTVQALGVGQQIYGTRADLIVCDDMVDVQNAHEWQKQIDWLQKMAITRLGKMGRMIIAGTRVAPVDFYREVISDEHWTGGRSPFTYLAMPAVLEYADDPKDWVTLWPVSDRPWDGDEDTEADENGHYSKWDGPTLFSRRSEVRPNTWALVYQQQSVQEDAVFQQVCVMNSINRMRKVGPINFDAPGHPNGGDWVAIMGFDPAMSGMSGFIMYAVNRESGERMVLDVHNMGNSTPQKIRALIENWVQIYRPAELRVEINAHQKAYQLDTELNAWLASRGCRLMPHFTGKNKWNESFGVAAMAGLFGSTDGRKHNGDNLLSLPSHENNEHVKALIQQLITWSAGTKEATDLLMALWFCEIRAREMIQQGIHLDTHMDNRWSTRRSEASKFIMNVDDYMADQYAMFL